MSACDCQIEECFLFILCIISMCHHVETGSYSCFVIRTLLPVATIRVDTPMVLGPVLASWIHCIVLLLNVVLTLTLSSEV